MLAAALPACGGDGKPVAPCTLDAGPLGTVARILDGETIALSDGSVVRLIGALAPRARDAGAATGAWPPESDAVKALSDLVLGKRVKLAFGGRHSDRYGRLLAHVFVEEGGGNEWVQGSLLAAGQARVYGLPGSFACTRELLAHESEARRRRIGLWANGAYRPVAASRPGALLRLRGKFERVIGTVVSVGRTSGATYLNFGADWHTDFTARIGKSVLAANADFGRLIDGLAQKTVIVRGWIERRNGPLIDIADPSEIEVVDQDGTPEGISQGEPPGPSQNVRAPGLSPDTEPPKDLRPAPPEGAEPGAVNL